MGEGLLIELLKWVCLGTSLFEGETKAQSRVLVLLWLCPGSFRVLTVKRFQTFLRRRGTERVGRAQASGSCGVPPPTMMGERFRLRTACWKVHWAGNADDFPGKLNALRSSLWNLLKMGFIRGYFKVRSLEPF